MLRPKGIDFELPEKEEEDPPTVGGRVTFGGDHQSVLNSKAPAAPTWFTKLLATLRKWLPQVELDEPRPLTGERRRRLLQRQAEIAAENA